MLWLNHIWDFWVNTSLDFMAVIKDIFKWNSLPHLAGYLAVFTVHREWTVLFFSQGSQLWRWPVYPQSLSSLLRALESNCPSCPPPLQPAPPRLWCPWHRLLLLPSAPGLSPSALLPPWGPSVTAARLFPARQQSLLLGPSAAPWPRRCRPQAQWYPAVCPQAQRQCRCLWWTVASLTKGTSTTVALT